MPATADIQAPFKEKRAVRPVPMAATTKIFAGTIVALNATGFAVPASDTAGLVVIGRAEEQVDNLTGLDGAKTITVASGIFRYRSTGANKLTRADQGQTCVVFDDMTVVKAAGATNDIVAGRVWADATITGEPADTWYVSIGENAQ